MSQRRHGGGRAGYRVIDEDDSHTAASAPRPAPTGRSTIAARTTSYLKCDLCAGRTEAALCAVVCPVGALTMAGGEQCRTDGAAPFWILISRAARSADEIRCPMCGHPSSGGESAAGPGRRLAWEEIPAGCGPLRPREPHHHHHRAADGHPGAHRGAHRDGQPLAAHLPAALVHALDHRRLVRPRAEIRRL